MSDFVPDPVKPPRLGAFRIGVGWIGGMVVFAGLSAAADAACAVAENVAGARVSAGARVYTATAFWLVGFLGFAHLLLRGRLRSVALGVILAPISVAAAFALAIGALWLLSL